MSQKRNVFAFTESNPPGGYPAYISINVDEAGQHSITVRSRGNGGRDIAVVEIPDANLCAMKEALPFAPAAPLAVGRGFASAEEALDAARNDAHRALDAAERAWYTYAAMVGVGPSRTRAFDIYDAVRCARSNVDHFRARVAEDDGTLRV